jgi:nicotinate dehydrogenase subunit B
MKKDDDHFTLDRREFLKLVGSGIVVFFTAGDPLLLAQRRGRGYPEDFNAYLRIGEDGRVTCFTGKIEMGQGIHTSLAQMLAEELDVPLESVDMVMGDTDLCMYDSGTFGSRSTKYFGPPLRQAAAEARAILIQLASEKLKIGKEKLSAKNGEVFMIQSPKTKISYAELAQGKKIEHHLEEKPPIKHYKTHTVSGRPTNRMDARQKVTGKAKFTGDIRLPGMLHAKILRPPAHGATLKSVDVSAAEKTEGVKIIQDGDTIAALHKHPDVAEKALGLIKAQFEPSKSKLDNQTIFQHLKDSAPEGNVVTEKGNIEDGKRLSAITFDASYFNHYVAHAPSEPHTAMVNIEGNKATVWASTQSPFRAQSEVAQVLGFPQEKVRVITPFVGCGFWRQKSRLPNHRSSPAGSIERKTGASRLDKKGRIFLRHLQARSGYRHQIGPR